MICNYKDYTLYLLFHRFHCGNWAYSFTSLLHFPLFVSPLPAEKTALLCWMEKAGKHCLTWNSITCGRQGRGQTGLAEQGVLWGLGNLVKESKFKTNGREEQKGWAGTSLVSRCAWRKTTFGIQLPCHVAALLCFALCLFFKRKYITSLGTKIVIFNYSV